MNTQAYLPCSLGAIESNLRLGERRTLKLRVCSSVICWCCIASLKDSIEALILDVGTTSWVFEILGCCRWNRVWAILKRCSMKIREGKSIHSRILSTKTGFEMLLHEPCPMFLYDCRSIATNLASSWEIQCESHLLTSSKADLCVWSLTTLETTET